MNILEEGKKVFDIEIDSLIYLRDNLDSSFVQLVEMIYRCSGRIIITGMGKSGHIGKKIAATMASLGTVTYFLHPAEGLHGDLGMVTKDDIVIAISYSGESDEVLGLNSSIKKIGAKLVSITGRAESSLAECSDLNIVLPIKSEASTYKLAPTTSTTATLLFGDALAVVLSKLKNFKPEDFALFHPMGSLGKRLLLKVEEIMSKGEYNPVINVNSNLKDAIIVMSSKGLGGVSVINENGELVGLLTDGDLRRIIERNSKEDIFSMKIKNQMTKNPICIKNTEKAIKALELMEKGKKKISILPVVDEKNILVGMLRIHDVIKLGII